MTRPYSVPCSDGMHPLRDAQSAQVLALATQSNGGPRSQSMQLLGAYNFVVRPPLRLPPSHPYDLSSCYNVAPGGFLSYDFCETDV